MNKKNKPEIRFSGFDDEWENSYVKNICDISNGKSNSQDQKEAGKYPFFIRSEDVVKSSRYLYDEEAVITIGDGNIGKVFHYINGKFDLHQRCYKMSNFKSVNGVYFYHYFSTKFYDRVMSLSAKATVDSVRLDMISDMEIKFPVDQNEQTKIGNFLKNIDDLIINTEKQYNHYKNIKDTLLNKMFPADYTNIPEIRFKGFAESFQSNIMGDLLKYEQPGKYIVKNDEYNDGNAGVPVLTAGQSFILGYTLEKFGIKNSSKNNPIIIFDDFITSSHYIDFPFKVKSSAIKILSTVNKESNLYYLYMILKQQQYSVVNHERHWISKFSKFDILVPKLTSEQTKIGELFKNIDELIALTKKKHEKLKNIKSALLNKMFC